MSARTASPSITQLCERTRRLIASARTQNAYANLKRELVIRELHFTAQRRGSAGSASQVHRQIAPR